MQDDRRAELTCADYSPRAKILTVGFSCGAFFVYELPECALLHSLSVSDHSIGAIAISPAGGADWIAIGCPERYRLID